MNNPDEKLEYLMTFFEAYYRISGKPQLQKKDYFNDEKGKILLDTLGLTRGRSSWHEKYKRCKNDDIKWSELKKKLKEIKCLEFEGRSYAGKALVLKHIILSEKHGKEIGEYAITRKGVYTVPEIFEEFVKKAILPKANEEIREKFIKFVKKSYDNTTELHIKDRAEEVRIGIRAAEDKQKNSNLKCKFQQGGKRFNVSNTVLEYKENEKTLCKSLVKRLLTPLQAEVVEYIGDDRGEGKLGNPDILAFRRTGLNKNELRLSLIEVKASNDFASLMKALVQALSYKNKCHEVYIIAPGLEGATIAIEDEQWHEYMRLCAEHGIGILSIALNKDGETIEEIHKLAVPQARDKIIDERIFCTHADACGYRYCPRCRRIVREKELLEQGNSEATTDLQKDCDCGWPDGIDKDCPIFGSQFEKYEEDGDNDE